MEVSNRSSLMFLSSASCGCDVVVSRSRAPLLRSSTSLISRVLLSMTMLLSGAAAAESSAAAREIQAVSQAHSISSSVEQQQALFFLQLMHPTSTAEASFLASVERQQQQQLEVSSSNINTEQAVLLCDKKISASVKNMSDAKCVSSQSSLLRTATTVEGNNNISRAFIAGGRGIAAVVKGLFSPVSAEAEAEAETDALSASATASDGQLQQEELQQSAQKVSSGSELSQVNEWDSQSTSNKRLISKLSALLEELEQSEVSFTSWATEAARVLAAVEVAGEASVALINQYRLSKQQDQQQNHSGLSASLLADLSIRKDAVAKELAGQVQRLSSLRALVEEEGEAFGRRRADRASDF